MELSRERLPASYFSGPRTVPVTIPVTVVVGDSVFRQLNPINFTKPLSGSNPLPQVLNVASTGAALAFDAVAVTANGGAWLTITSCGSWCTTPEAITVTANPAVTLAAGNYSGEVLFTVHGSRTISMTVPVTLTIAASTATFFDSLAGQLSFSMLTAGNSPPCQSVQIRNGGSGTLTWSAKASTADGGAWLTVSPASGAVASHDECVRVSDGTAGRGAPRRDVYGRDTASVRGQHRDDSGSHGSGK